MSSQSPELPSALRFCGFMNFPNKQRPSYLGLFYILIPKDIFPVDCTPGTLIISCLPRIIFSKEEVSYEELVLDVCVPSEHPCGNLV